MKNSLMENFIFLCSGTTLVAPENLTVKRFSSTKYLLQIWYLLNRLAIIYCKKAQKEKNLFSTNYCLQSMILTEQFSLNKKWSSPLRISSVNVTKPDQITNTKEILNGELHFLCSFASPTTKEFSEKACFFTGYPADHDNNKKEIMDRDDDDEYELKEIISDKLKGNVNFLFYLLLFFLCQKMFPFQ